MSSKEHMISLEMKTFMLFVFMAAYLGLFATGLVAGQDKTGGQPENSFLGLDKLLFAGFGSLILYFFGQPAKADFLQTRFPNWSPGLVKDVCSFIIYVVVGAVVGCLIARPDSPNSAFMSGFGWPAFLDLGARGKKLGARGRKKIRHATSI